MPENNRRFAPLAKSVVIEYVEITGSVPRNATIITKSSIPTGSNIDPTEEFIKITSTNKVYRLVAKQPSVFDATNKPNGLKLGEVAVNFKQDFEALFISNNSNGILKFTPIKENIDLYETSQRAATAMAVNEFVLPVEKTYTPSTTLSYTVNENEVYFPSSSTGIATLNLTVNAYNSNQDFVRPATFYFKTSSNGCTVNLLGAALDSVYGVADPSNISLIGNSTYRIIIKDKRAFIECAIPDLSRIEHGEGIIFRNAADTQDKTTLAEAGLIKIKPATTTDKGGVKVYGSSNTNVTATTRPASPKTNRTYGLEIGNDDKAYVYVPWEKIKEINYTGTENGNTLISAELSSQDADGNVSLNIGRANRLVTVNSATGNGNTVTAVGEDSNHNVTVTTANRLVSVNNATGDGNAVTAIGEDANHNITVTKGVTFVNTVIESGTGIVLTSIQQNGAVVTATKSKLSYNSLEDKPTIGSGKFKIQSNSSTAVNTNFTANTTDDTVGVKFVNGGNVTVTAAASTSSTPATVTMGVASGYSIPSDTKQSEWDAKSDTDTKNTAGSMNTSDKIYIVGAKTKATTADNDNKQTYTNGNNYVGSDGWLYTGNNEKVLVDANLDFIREALASMEEWPTVSTETTVSPQPTCYLTTNAVPNTIANYYRVTYGSTNVDVSNGGVYRAGSSLATRNNISVNTTATFYPSTDVTYIAKNRIYGMDYGYKNNLSDTTKYTEHEKTSTTQIATTCDRTNVSKTSNTKIELFKKVNSGNYNLAASANNSGATTSITIASGTNLGTLEEGTTKLLIKYTNPSTIARTEASGNVDGITAYYSSNINNFDSTHKKTITTQTVTIGEVETTYANSSTNGVKTGTELTIYGVYPLYTNGSRNQSGAITGDNRTNGSTGSASTYREFVSLINYAANATSTWYISFGEIDTNNANLNKAYIFTPNVTGGRSVTITSVQGANSSTGSYDSGTVNMTIANDATVNITVDGVSRSYKRWWIKNPGGSEGANSYKVTITATNE